MRPYFETGRPRTTSASEGVLSRIVGGLADGMTILLTKFGARDLRADVRLLECRETS